MAWTRAAAVEIAASQGFSRRRASGWRGRVRSVGCSIKRQWMHIRDACMAEGQDDYSYRGRGKRELEGRRCTTSWSRECGTWVSAATCPWRQRGSPAVPRYNRGRGALVRRSSGEARSPVPVARSVSFCERSKFCMKLPPKRPRTRDRPGRGAGGRDRGPGVYYTILVDHVGSGPVLIFSGRSALSVQLRRASRGTVWRMSRGRGSLRYGNAAICIAVGVWSLVMPATFSWT